MSKLLKIVKIIAKLLAGLKCKSQCCNSKCDKQVNQLVVEQHPEAPQQHGYKDELETNSN
tara:strand:+ start:822 stop:1001 length:180 start_codon:yes stop_codon:yes gene_type:complete